jgi:tetratricopeptide (TPR) repeat protein
MSVPALSPLVELVRASRARATGAFALSAPAGGGLTVVLQGGAVVEVGGVPGLLSGVGVSGSGSLQQDLGAAVGAGVGFDKALNVAGEALGRVLVAAVEIPGAQGGFTPGASPAGAFPLPISVTNLLSAAWRQHRGAEALQRALAPLQRHTIQLVEGQQADGLDPTLTRLMQRAKTGPSVEALLAEAAAKGPARRDEVARGVELLVHLGLVNLVAPVKAARPAVAAPAAPAGPTPEELLSLARQLRVQSPLQALGLTETPAAEITREKVQSAFRSVANRHHPDRYSGQSEAHRAAAMEVFAALNEHSSALAEPAALQLEVEKLACAQRGEVWVSEMDKERAKVVIKRALAAEQARSFQNARDLAQEARALHPGSLEGSLLSAYFRAVLKELPLPDALALIDGLAMPNDRLRAEAAYRAGRLYSLAERPNEARARFARCVELNPNHTDAQRELRVLQRRGRPEPVK